jgi:hypothetical protein
MQWHDPDKAVCMADYNQEFNQQAAMHFNEHDNRPANYKKRK